MAIKNFSEIKGLLGPRFLSNALDLAHTGQFVTAAAKFDDLRLTSEQQAQHGDLMAYTYYRRALFHLSQNAAQKAINDLETARSFPSIASPLRSLIQDRLTKIQSGSKSESATRLDDAISRYFETSHSALDLRQEFLRRYGLRQPQRTHDINYLDGISTVGVYRWVADSNYGEQWSRLIRKFKTGDETITAFFGRVLAEHLRTNKYCSEWLSEIDYILPVPADAQRSAVRGADIVADMADNLGQRLGIPHRTDILKREEFAHRARSTSRPDLEKQYSLASDKKMPYVQGRILLLLDDVTNRGHTASICAQRLKEAGCQKVYLLALAQAESTLQSRRHFGHAKEEESSRLAPWLCLADTDGLGPVRLKALLTQFSTARSVLEAGDQDLRKIQDIGPKVSESIRRQSSRCGEYAVRAAQLLDTASTIDARILTIQDPNYPANLAESGAGPAIVYVLASSLPLLQERNTVAIVGTRRPVPAAAEAASSIATALAQNGWITVSGMAEGIDSLAHRACLEAQQPTIAFLGNGVDITYPPSAKALRHEIARRGVLVSEYPFGMRINENRLRRRNALTVGHSRAVIVIQSATTGGTMNAVRAAERLGKPILCLEPFAGHETEFSGNAALLSAGIARPISDHDPLMSLLAAVS